MSNWLQYFVSGCQAETCVRSHKNYSTISSTHHSLHYSLSLDSLFCDTLLSCNSETVVQRSYKLMLDYKAQRRRRAEVSRNSIWAAQTSQVHSLKYESIWVEPSKNTLVLKSIFFLMSQTGVHDNNYFLHRDFFLKSFIWTQ